MIFNEGNIFVGLEVPQITGEKIALIDGLLPSELHVTLGIYDPALTDLSTAAKIVGRAVQSFMVAEEDQSLSVESHGTARFNTEDGEPDAFVMLLCGEEIYELQEAIEERFENWLAENLSSYEFLPHVTLQLIAEDDPVPVQRIPNEVFRFRSVVVGQGSTAYRIPIATGPYELDVVV